MRAKSLGILEQIINYTRKRVERERKELVLPKRQRPIIDFRGALEKGAFSIIAEFKPSSPSGVKARWSLVEYLPRVKLADALSVLTEPKWFKGSYWNVYRASQLTAKPILLKDFVIDDIQIEAAYSFGADAVLLMIDVLNEDDLKYLALKAKAKGLQTLVEVSSIEWAEALSKEPWVDILGVNSRDFKTLKVSVERIFKISRYIDERAFPLAESGVKGSKEAYELGLRGYRGALVGTSLMESIDPMGLISEIKFAGTLGLFSIP